MTRPCMARIYLNRLRLNYQKTRELAGAGVEIFPVVKADAYGHNAIACTKALLAEGARTFCVASADEALEIIESGVKARFLLLSGMFPGEESTVVRHRLIPAVSELGTCARLDAEARSQGRKVRVHVKVDTGMGRLGVSAEGFPQFLAELSRLSGIEIEGVLSHLSCADSHAPEFEQGSAEQIHDFQLIVKALAPGRPELKYFHLAGSAGLIKYPAARFTSARPGLMLYGADPFYPEATGAIELSPVMSFMSKICLIKTLPEGSRISYGGKSALTRKSRVGVAPLGYADGLPRSTPPGYGFLVRGKPAALLGVVTMDLIMVDLTDIPEAEAGDELLIFGREPSGEGRVEKLASAGRTISYEIFTRLGKRVNKEFLTSE